MRLMLCMIVVMALWPSSAFSQRDVSIAFLNPGPQGDVFFDMMTSFMHAAADDLGMDLEVIYCDRDRYAMAEKGRQLLAREELPDYLILVNEQDGARAVLEACADRDVKVALINEGLLPKDKARLGRAGKTIPNWVLEYLPDDYQAGELLAKSLIQAALDKGLTDASGKVHMAGIAGNYATGSSEERVAGLQKAVSWSNRAVLHQIVPGYWDRDTARGIAEGVIRRYPDVTVIWAASDLMAMGALDAYEERGRQLITGGVDWTQFALDKVAQGDFAATVGGHFMDGAWAMVILYDLHHGIPLKSSTLKSPFSLITKENVSLYLQYFSDQEWGRIDFRKFSKKDNPSLREYDFSLEQVFKQLKTQ